MLEESADGYCNNYYSDGTTCNGLLFSFCDSSASVFARVRAVALTPCTVLPWIVSVGKVCSSAFRLVESVANHEDSCAKILARRNVGLWIEVPVKTVVLRMLALWSRREAAFK